MPPSLPPHLDAFLREPHPAVVASSRADGSPVTSPTWYRYDGRSLLLSMHDTSARLRRLRANPALALTVLADDWYSHLSLTARVDEIRHDPDRVDLDGLSQHYRGEPYPDRTTPVVTVTGVIASWHTFGDPQPRP